MKKSISKNLIFYVIIGIVIVAVAYVALSVIVQGPYEMNLKLYSTNTTNLYPFNTTTFALVLNNTGSRDIKDMIVGFYLSGNPTPIKEYNVSIPAHQNAEVLLNYTYYYNGTYDFEAIADPAHLFNINHRNATQQAISIKVNSALAPAPFTSIPNNNIVSSTNFRFSGDGLPLISELAQVYNMSPMESLYSSNATLRNVVEAMLKDSYGSINSTFGAYAKYKNGSVAESIWMQGTANPTLLSEVAKSFGLKEYQNSSTTMFVVGKNTSTCIAFNGGWTRVVTYYSNGTNATCASITKNPYNQTQTYYLSKLISNNSEMLGYSEKFIYTNSSNMGSEFAKNSNTMYLVNAFQNQHGIFFSYIGKNFSGLSIEKNASPRYCYGLLSNNSEVCSVYLAPASGVSGTSNYSAVESKEVTSNYTATLYSIVSSAEAVDAHYNAAMLLGKLNLSGTPYLWSSPFKNTCALNSTILNCSIGNFSQTSNIANITLSNRGKEPIHLNYMYCYMSGTPIQQNLTYTLAPNSSKAFNIECSKLAVPIVGFTSAYGLDLNYSINSTYHQVVGSLNITSFS